MSDLCQTQTTTLTHVIASDQIISRVDVSVSLLCLVYVSMLSILKLKQTILKIMKMKEEPSRNRSRRSESIRSLENILGSERKLLLEL